MPKKELKAYANTAFAHKIFRLSSSRWNISFPDQKKGTDDLENLALACSACNNSKYDKTTDIDPVTKQSVRLFHPRKHRWERHFMWNNDYTEIIGLTKTGRATVAALKLNRERIIRIRKALYLLGKHPPK